MNIIARPLDGALVIEPRRIQDERGFFLETYEYARYQSAGVSDDFVQDNQARSVKGVLRGLHFRVKRPEAKLVTIVRGRVFDVGVDIRPGSPTFGRWFGVELCDEGPRQLYLPPGFAHGYCVLSDWADIHYKVSRRYDPSDEGGLRWNDPAVGIQWPIDTPILTARDAAHPSLRDLTPDRLPHHPALPE